MDPISAAAAVVSAVCAIVGAVNAAHELHARRKERKGKKASAAASGSGPGAQSAIVPIGAFKLSVRVNYLMSRLGRHSLDGGCQDHFFRLLGDWLC